jgi:hypothetical protein
MQSKTLKTQFSWKFLNWRLQLVWIILLVFCCGPIDLIADSSELRGMSAVRSEVLQIIQLRTNKELKSETELTVRSWTNTNDHVLVIAKPQVSMFRDRIIFALLQKETRKRSEKNWKIVDYKAVPMNQSPLKAWEKKYKILPKDMFMLAQIAIQVED